MTRGWILPAILCFVLFGSEGRAVGPPAKSPAAEPVTALAFARDGRSIVIGGYARLRIRALDGKGERTLKVAPQQVRDVAFHPTGRWLAVAGGSPGGEGVLELLAWPSGNSLKIVRDRQDVVHAAVFNPEGTLLAAAGADRNVRLYQFDPKAVPSPVLAPLPPLEGHSGMVLALSFSPDGKTLLTAGADRSIRVWDPNAGKLLRVFTNHLDTVHAVAYSPTGTVRAPAFSASASEDRTVRVWQPEIGRMVRILRGFEGPVLAVTYARDGQQLFCADTAGRIRAFDASSDQELRSWPAHKGWIYRLALSPDGSRLASGDWSGEVKLWNPSTGQPMNQ